MAAPLLGSEVNRPPWVRHSDDGWQMLVRVQPGAKKSEISGEIEGRLKVRIHAQAVDNKANKALSDFIAQKLGLRAKNVAITAGETSRQKTLTVTTKHEPDWETLRLPDVS